MMIRYHLDQGDFFAHPRYVDPIVDERVNIGRALARLFVSPHDLPSEYRWVDRSGNTITSYARFPRGIVHPSHWYRLGCPVDGSHLSLMCRLLRLQPSHHVGTGSFDAEAWVRAIRWRPLLVASDVSARYGGGIGNFFHMRVVKGISYLNHSSGAIDAESCVALVIDPAEPDIREMPLFRVNALRPILHDARPWTVLHYMGGHNRAVERSEEEQGPPNKG